LSPVASVDDGCGSVSKVVVEIHESCHDGKLGSINTPGNPVAEVVVEVESKVALDPGDRSG
jgi:hypothetical protein